MRSARGLELALRVTSRADPGREALLHVRDGIRQNEKAPAAPAP